jgi:hypothetical protein
MNKYFLGGLILIYLATGIAGCTGTTATETVVTTLPAETKTVITTATTTSISTTVSTSTLTTTVFSTSTTTTATSLPATTSTTKATPIGSTVKFRMQLSKYLGGDYLYEYHTFEMTVLEVVRGTKAWDMVKAASATNKAPDAGYEYLLARVKFVHVSGGSLTTSIKEKALEAYSSEGKAYEFPSVMLPGITFPGPVIFDKVLESGQTAEGWVTFIVKQSDTRPLMLYWIGYEWFQLY